MSCELGAAGVVGLGENFPGASSWPFLSHCCTSGVLASYLLSTFTSLSSSLPSPSSLWVPEIGLWLHFSPTFHLVSVPLQPRLPGGLPSSEVTIRASDNSLASIQRGYT